MIRTVAQCDCCDVIVDLDDNGLPPAKWVTVTTWKLNYNFCSVTCMVQHADVIERVCQQYEEPALDTFSRAFNNLGKAFTGGNKE